MKDWLDLSIGAVRWRVHPDWRDRLFDENGLRFSEWRESGDLEIIKEAPHRAVYRVRLPLTTHHSPVSALDGPDADQMNCSRNFGNLERRNVLMLSPFTAVSSKIRHFLLCFHTL